MVFLKVRAIQGPNEDSCWILNLQTRIPEAGGDLHFSFSAVGGTTVPFLSTVPNLKWAICYGPKGSRKEWPNLTKPEGHKKDFEQNVSDLLALPIPSQLLRANNLHVMDMGEEVWRRIRKDFLAKPASFRQKKQMNSTVFAQTQCVLGWVGTSEQADTEQQQPGTQGSMLGTLLDLMVILCTLTWRSSTPQHQSCRIHASRFVLTSLRTQWELALF